MKYDVTRYGPGGIETITVDADSGDEAATKAFKPGTAIRGIAPSEDQSEPVKRRRGQTEDA